MCSLEVSTSATTVAISGDDESHSTTNYTETNIATIFESETEAPTNVTAQKPFYTTGNELWDNMIRDCLKKPTFSCIQKNVYNYLDTTLNLNDVNVTNRLRLTRNQFDYQIPINSDADEENEIDFEGRGKLKAILFGNVE